MTTIRENDKNAFLPDNAIASLSNAVLCLSSETTVMQRRLFYSCLSMFNNSDNNIMSDIREIALKQKGLAKTEYLKNNKDALNNLINFENEFDNANNLKKATINYFALNSDKRTFTFNFKELMEFWTDAKTPSSQFTALKNAIDGILDIKFINEFTDKSGKKHTLRYNVFSYDDQVEVLNSVESISLTLNHDFIPYIVFLNEIYNNVGYTKTPLVLLTKKKKESSFAILNMLLRLYKKDNIEDDNKNQCIKMTIETFRRFTDTENKLKKFNDLKVRFIEPGVEELNNDPNININVSYTKKGRSFDSLIFNFSLEN